MKALGTFLLVLFSLFTIPGSSQHAFATGAEPVITLTGTNPQLIQLGGSYSELGATALDAEDGDISGSVSIDDSAVDTGTIGAYEVTYEVTDSDGNTVSKIRTVGVVPIGSLPTLTLTGSNPQLIHLNDPYVDLGATASDAEDGDISGSISTSGTVDTSTEGIYQISYQVTDSDGNVVTKNRVVQVYDTTITWTGAGDGTTWSDVTNWDLGRVPIPTDNVVITGTTPVELNIAFMLNQGSITVPAGSTLTLNQNLFITSASSIGIYGQLTNNVYLKNEGFLINNNQFTNEGLIDNLGTIDNQATFTNNDHINNSGIFLNDGTLTTIGEFANNNILTSTGLVHIDGFMNNDFVFTNNGGTINNDASIE